MNTQPFHEFFTGINYWASKNAIRMWEDFDAPSIERDMKLLKDAGITHLRVFPLWPVFQPLKALYGPQNPWEYGLGEAPLPDAPAGRAGVSEAACEKFEIFCTLAHRYGLKLIVALITGHMSFRTYAPPAFEGKALLSDPTVLKWQIRFVKYFVGRFRTEPAIIAWDLGNEPENLPGLNGNPDTFYVWSSLIADAVKTRDQEHPVISGVAFSHVERMAANLKTVGETCDMNTTHPYNIFQTAADPLPTMKPILDLAFRCKMSEDIGGVPTFVQEFGATGYMNCSPKTEADFYRAALLTSVAHGCRGAMWWCAFDQGHLRYAPYRWNTIGSDYGFFDKNRNPKPIVRENMRFQESRKKLPGGVLPPHVTNGTIIVPRDDGGTSVDTIRAAYLLAKQANMDMNFCYALDAVPDSQLYLFPSIGSSKAIGRTELDGLMEKVKDGAVLYLSADTGLMCDIPQITGVDISYRRSINRERIMEFKGRKLPVSANFFFQIEKADAEALACDENGEPMFFKHRYGKGFVFFLMVPLERYLAEKDGAFFDNRIPGYDSVYRELAAAANVHRIVDCDNRYIRFTEHISDDGRYLFGINYNNKPESAKLTVQPGYDVSVVFGDGWDGETLSLRENDGILMRAVKKRDKCQ